jgi:hypothetical protein
MSRTSEVLKIVWTRNSEVFDGLIMVVVRIPGEKQK